MRLRRRSMLAYEVPRPVGLAAVNEAMLAMTGRHSVEIWRRHCEASLRASRRRRGLQVDQPRVSVREIARLYEVPERMVQR